MPSDTDTAMPTAAIARGKSLLDGAVEQRGVFAAALVAFLGVAVLGPKLTRMRMPRTRAQRLRDEAAFQAERLRRRAQKSGARARKSTRKAARRLGGGRLERYI